MEYHEILDIQFKTNSHNPIQNFPEFIGNPNNRAHSLVVGDKNKDAAIEMKNLKIAVLLSGISNWELFDEKVYKDLRSKQN